MKQSRVLQTIKLCCLILLGNTVASMAEAEEPPTVEVGVYAKHHGNRIVYNYRVINNLAETIDSITIGGYSEQNLTPYIDVWELFELPSGWHPKLGIPSASSNSPTDWRVSMITSEESEAHAIRWEAINNRSPLLLGGQSLAKMSISLDRPDSSYLTSHATVHFTDRDPATLTVPIEQLDNVSPALIVSLVPDTLRSANSELMPVNVVFTVKDDYFDHLPEIRLESITANETLEYGDIRDASFGIDDRYIKLRAHHNDTADRIYTVFYSATDASGNQTLSSATVTVPYDPPEVMQPTTFFDEIEASQTPITLDNIEKIQPVAPQDQYKTIAP